MYATPRKCHRPPSDVSRPRRCTAEALQLHLSHFAMVAVVVQQSVAVVIVLFVEWNLPTPVPSASAQHRSFALVDEDTVGRYYPDPP